MNEHDRDGLIHGAGGGITQDETQVEEGYLDNPLGITAGGVTGP